MEGTSFEEFCKAHNLNWSIPSIRSIGGISHATLTVTNGKKTQNFEASSPNTTHAVISAKTLALETIQTNFNTWKCPPDYLDSLCEKYKCNYVVTYKKLNGNYEGSITLELSVPIKLEFSTKIYSNIHQSASEKAVLYFNQLE